MKKFYLSPHKASFQFAVPQKWIKGKTFLQLFVEIDFSINELDGLWTFVALHGAFRLLGFMLRQFKPARSVQLRPYNAIAFPGPITLSVSINF